MNIFECGDISRVVFRHIDSEPIKINKKEPRYTGAYHILRIVESQVMMLNEAHLQLEKGWALRQQYGTICKDLNKIVHLKFADIEAEIVEKLEKIHSGDGGYRCFRECVDTTFYLSVLKVYYTAKPAKLKDAPNDKYTIFQIAFRPNYFVHSLSFIKHILNLNQSYFVSNLTESENLDLLNQRFPSGVLPIHSLCEGYKNEHKILLGLLTLLFSFPTGTHEINATTKINVSFGKKNEKVLMPPLYFLNDKENIDLLIENKADVNFQNEQGYTILHLWAGELKHKSIPLLLEHVKDLNMKTNQGETALDLALLTIFNPPYRKNDEKDEYLTVKCLLDNGATVGSNYFLQKSFIESLPNPLKTLLQTQFEKDIIDDRKLLLERILSANKIKPTEEPAPIEIEVIIPQEKQFEETPPIEIKENVPPSNPKHNSFEFLSAISSMLKGTFNYLFDKYRNTVKIIFEFIKNYFSSR